MRSIPSPFQLGCFMGTQALWWPNCLEAQSVSSMMEWRVNEPPSIKPRNKVISGRFFPSIKFGCEYGLVAWDIIGWRAGEGPTELGGDGRQLMRGKHCLILCIQGTRCLLLNRGIYTLFRNYCGNGRVNQSIILKMYRLPSGVLDCFSLSEKLWFRP